MNSRIRFKNLTNRAKFILGGAQWSRRKPSQDFTRDSKRVLVLGFFLSLLLTACQDGEGNAPPLPTLAPGKAMVIGRVVADETSQPIPRRPVWLSEVLRQGDQVIFVLNTISSRSSPTDRQGRFVLANVDPKEYVIVVGDPHSSDYAIISEAPDTARVWKLEADKTLNVGELRVWFKP